jgi:membrane protein YqaA with SNARE-associated domain
LNTLKELRWYPILGSIVLALVLFFAGKNFPPIQRALLISGYAGVFVVGILYVYSFTTLPATALLFILGKFHPVWIAGTIATLGSVLGDLVLFGLFRSAKRFAEVDPDRETRYLRWWHALERKTPPRWRDFLIVVLIVALFILPLPNEFADFLLARIKKVRTSVFLLISYALNGATIYLILWFAWAVR